MCFCFFFLHYTDFFAFILGERVCMSAQDPLQYFYLYVICRKLAHSKCRSVAGACHVYVVAVVIISIVTKKFETFAAQVFIFQFKKKTLDSPSPKFMEPAEKRQQIPPPERDSKFSKQIKLSTKRKEVDRLHQIGCEKKLKLLKLNLNERRYVWRAHEKRRRETDINGLSGRVTSAICLDSNETQMRMWNAKKKRERNQYATLLCICTARCMCRTWIEVERVWPLSVWYAAHKRSSRDINCNSFFLS